MLRPYKKTLALDLAGGFDPLLDQRRRLTQALVAQFVILNAGHFDVNVDAVKQGAGDAFLVLGDNAR